MQDIIRYEFGELGSGWVVVGTCLYRDGPWQVEMFTYPASASGGEIVDHRHPNVDSVEVHVVGDIYFRVNGRQIATRQQYEMTDERGRQLAAGQSLRIKPRDWHGATIGPRGGTFLSLQHWLNGVEPSSVGLDWEGSPLIRTNRDKHV
jgi:hypothetical protein